MAQPVDEALYLAAIARVCRGSNVIGVAFFVAEGYLLTCAHVVAKALGHNRKSYQIPAADILHKEIPLEFRLGDAEMSAEAKVVYWRFPEHDPRFDNDVAVLKLQEPMPAGAQYFSLLPSSEYWNQAFRVLGFPSKLDPGGWATGTIQGKVYDTSGMVQMKDDQTTGYAIEPGFSGSPVWSPTLDNTIVGMTVARDKEREEAKVGFMLPVRQLKRALEAVELESLMDIWEPQVNFLGNVLPIAYPIAAGERITTFPMSTQADPVQALRENLTQLLSIPNQNLASPGTLPFAVAMLTLPDLGLPDSSRNALKTWLQHRATDLASLLAAAQQAVTDAAAQVSTQAHLLLWVRTSPEYESQDRYLVSGFCIPEPNAYNPTNGTGCKPLKAVEAFRDAQRGDTIARGELEKVLQACLQEVCTSYRQEIAKKELILELLLPIPLLNHAVDQWNEQAPQQIPAYLRQLLDQQPGLEETDCVALLPVGYQYQVMLRIAERVEPIFASRRTQWEAKWSALKQAENDKKQAKQVLVAGHCKDFQSVFARGNCLGMHLNTILPDTSLRSRLLALVIGATPTALWMRQPTSKTSYKKPLKDLLEHPVGDIACKVREARQTAFDKRGKPHFGRHLALVWDNPQLVPPEAEIANTLDMPQEIP
jgi:hypothetical protein